MCFSHEEINEIVNEVKGKCFNKQLILMPEQRNEDQVIDEAVHFIQSNPASVKITIEAVNLM